MAVSNFDACLKFTLQYEGGYVFHKKDPGGETNLGITKRVLEGWRGRGVSSAEMKALTRMEAGMIYRANYWNAVGGDLLPAGIDLVVWDYGVNSGPSRGIKALQKALGVKVDGHIGPATKSAAKAADPRAIVNAVCDERRRFVRGLNTYSTFGKGWERRIAAVRALGLQMAAGEVRSIVTNDEPAQAKADPRDKSMTKSSTAITATVGGVSGTVAATKAAVDVAKEATEAAKGGWGIAASVGPWVLLILVVAGAAAYIIWHRRNKAREEGV